MNDFANRTDSATGTHYARLRADASSAGSVWGVYNAVGSSGGTRAFINFYFRTSMSQVQPQLHQFDANWQEISAPQTAPQCQTSAGWVWSSYVHRCGSWVVSLDPRTIAVSLSVSAATAPSGASYLDIDGLSMSFQ